MTAKFKSGMIALSFIILGMAPITNAGNIGLKMGLDYNYKSYSKETDNETYSSGSQMDRFYTSLEYNRDLYRGRLGNIMLKVDLNQYGLNYYDNQKPDMTLPFTAYEGDVNDNKLYHNINSVINLRLPKQKVSMRLKWNDRQDPQIDKNQYFQALNKIKDDAKDLEGISSTLENSKYENNRNFYIHKSSRYINMMGEIDHYQMNDGNIETAYVNENLTWQTGIDFKNAAGIHYQKVSEKYNQNRKNEFVSTITLGLINAFGTETDYRIHSDLTATQYLKREVTHYQNEKFTDDEGYGKLIWKKNHSHVSSEYQYNKSEDPDTNDKIVSHHVQLFVQNNKSDKNIMAKYTLEKSNVNRQAISGYYIDSLDLPAAISNTLIGPGYITFQTLGEPIEIDLSGLTLNGEDPLNGSVLISIDAPYTISFNTSLEGSITILNGIEEDLYAMFTRTKSGQYDLTHHAMEFTYDRVFSKTFRSKTDLFAQYSDYTNAGDNETIALQPDSQQLWIRQNFEIRPGRLIFDISGNYYQQKENDRNYKRYEIKSKDGFMTAHTHLYLETDWYTRVGNGYDDVTEQRYKLVGQHKGDKFKFSIDPYFLKKETENSVIETESVFRSNLTINTHSLELFWKNRKDENKGETASTQSSKETRINYRINNRHVLLDSSYRYYNKDYKKNEYRSALTLISYKPMYQNSYHTKLTLSYEKDYTYLSSGDLEDDYIGIKIAYTPTFRIEAVLSLERQIQTHDKSDDIEFLMKYNADIFSTGLGYRKMNVNINDERKVENVIYFQISKGISLGNFMRY